ESSHGFSFDNRLASLGVYYPWQDNRPMAYSCNNASPIPHVCGNCLKSSGARIVIECRMTGRSEKQPVSFLFQVRRLPQLRIQLNIERMLRVLKDGLVIARQEAFRKREIV